jgi:gas vesicle protein
MEERDWDEHYVEMHSNNMGGFVAGLLIGALAGAAAMLLMAPASGEETRARIGEKTTHLKERVAETAEDARQRAREVTDDMRGRVEKLQHRGQEMLEEQRTRVSDAVEAGKQSMRRR